MRKLRGPFWRQHSKRERTDKMSVVRINGVPHKVAAGSGLKELLAGETGFSMPCGGHGKCGKCRVRAGGKLSAPKEAERAFLSEEELARGIRLACLTAVEGDCSVSAAGAEEIQIQIGGELPPFPCDPSFTAYGAAVDIGTTTLAACLYDVRGKALSEVSGGNPQAGWGADVLSRIEAALNGAAGELTRKIREAVDELLIRLAAEAGIRADEIDGLAITGNTTMLYLFAGEDVEPLSHAPFEIRRKFGETHKARELGLAAPGPDACVYLPPCISAFVGADMVTALLASGVWEQSGTHLLADIGTNGETALYRDGRLLVGSTAAGPAFEGAGLSCGMQGRGGAIDSVSLCDGRLTVHVIGEGEAVGICGSGIVDAVACLLETGQVDETGYMEEETVSLTDSVKISQEDIRMVQLAKAAVHAGIRTLLHRAGGGCGEVRELLIAGGFGSYLNVGSAGKIGLIPEELAPVVRVIGNAALGGAAMLLLNRGFCEVCVRRARQAEVIELSTDSFFAGEYIEQMQFYGFPCTEGTPDV